MPERKKPSVPAEYEDSLLVLLAIKAKYPKPVDTQDTMKCPACQIGTVNFRISGSNGHVWARCSTAHCVSFLQ